MSKEDRIRDLAKMFNVMDPEHREKLLKDVALKDPDLVSAILEQFFGFEDIAQMEPKYLQILLQKVPSSQLILALRNAAPPFIETILGQLSKRTAEELKEQLSSQGPQKLTAVQAAQAEIVKLAKELEGQGKLLLKRQ